MARKPRQEQTVQDPALAKAQLAILTALNGPPLSAAEEAAMRCRAARPRPVEIVPQAKPDYILRREQRQAFADRLAAERRAPQYLRMTAGYGDPPEV